MSFTLAGEYATCEQARKRARQLRGKFKTIKVKKGMKGVAWGRPHRVCRVWVK